MRFQKKSFEGTATPRRKKFSLALDADRHSWRAVRVETGRLRVAVTGRAVAVMGLIEALEEKAKEQARQPGRKQEFVSAQERGLIVVFEWTQDRGVH